MAVSREVGRGEMRERDTVVLEAINAVGSLPKILHWAGEKRDGRGPGIQHDQTPTEASFTL